MTLNSLDIQNKTFNLQFRGYHKQEVDEFLQIIVNDYDEMTLKLKDNERDIKALKERLKDFDNMKESLNKSIIVAQSTADNMQAQAERDAERKSREVQQRSKQILDSAEREARQVLQSTYDEARRLINESDELKRGMRSYYQRITMLIEGQLANIKSTEWEEALKPSPIYVGESEEKLREIIEHTNQAFQPIDSSGKQIEREGEKAPETLESFEHALNSELPEPAGSTVDSTSQENLSPIQSRLENDKIQEKKEGTFNIANNINFGVDN